MENWEIIALQTEEERGESGFALPLEISRSRNITVANYHGYRVISSYQPFCCAIKVSESSDIRIRNMHTDSNSKVAFDNALVVAPTPRIESDSTAMPKCDRGSLPRSTSPGHPATTEHATTQATVLEPGAHARTPRHAASSTSPAPPPDHDGQLYFVDAHWQRIYRWSPQTREAVVIRDTPLEPVNLAFDKSGDLLVVSYAGKGTVYSFRPDSRRDSIRGPTHHARAARSMLYRQDREV